MLTNSGCANACTGPQGLADAREMADAGSGHARLPARPTS